MNATALNERIDGIETGMWAFLRECLRADHHAAALVMSVDDPDTVTVLLDGDVVVDVSVRLRGASDVERMTLQLGDVPMLVLTGAESIDLRAPEPIPAAFLATAFEEIAGSWYVTSIRDIRGIGALAWSTIPLPDGRPFGEWFRQWAARSGVPQVNDRRAKAMRHLYAVAGKRDAQDMLTSIAIQAIFEQAEWLGCEWTVHRHPGSELVAQRLEPSPPRPRRPADRIVSELAGEAHGGRLKSAKARDWEQRLESEPDRLDAHGQTVARLTDGRRVATEGQRTWRAQMHSDWEMRQRGRDPSGEMATALADGKITLSTVLAHDLGTGSLVAAWAAAGLTRRQQQVLFATQLGLKQEAIAACLRITTGTVADHLKKAQERIHDPEPRKGPRKTP